VNHLEELGLRRRELVERSAAQRRALEGLAQPLVQKAAVFDRASASVRRYPVISSLVAGAVVLFGSRRLFTWISRGLALYAILRKT
jgi:YqjK-like protein